MKKDFKIPLIILSIIAIVAFAMSITLLQFKKANLNKEIKESNKLKQEKTIKENENTKDLEPVKNIENNSAKTIDIKLPVFVTTEILDADYFLREFARKNNVLISAKIKKVNNGIFGDFGEKQIVKTRLELTDINVLNSANVTLNELSEIYIEGGKALVYETFKWQENLKEEEKQFAEYDKYKNISSTEQKTTYFKTTFLDEIDFKNGEEVVFLVSKSRAGKYFIKRNGIFLPSKLENNSYILQNKANSGIKIEKIGTKFRKAVN